MAHPVSSTITGFLPASAPLHDLSASDKGKDALPLKVEISLLNKNVVAITKDVSDLRNHNALMVLHLEEIKSILKKCLDLLDTIYKTPELKLNG